jgi:hypothetical protein
MLELKYKNLEVVVTPVEGSSDLHIEIFHTWKNLRMSLLVFSCEISDPEYAELNSLIKECNTEKILERVFSETSKDVGVLNDLVTKIAKSYFNDAAALLKMYAND